MLSIANLNLNRLAKQRFKDAVAKKLNQLQSNASSHAKHGGAFFSVVRGSIKDPIAVPGRDEVLEC